MDLHTNDSSESAAGVFVSDKCQIPVGGIPQQEPDRQQYYMALCRQKVQEISDKLGRPLTCFISTFGCQMNAHDSEKLLGILLEAGFVEGTSEESDFVLYNTCTVRENANLRVYGRLGYLHSLKKKNPHMMIALCGCMMQEPEVVEKLKKSYRFVDLIFGTHNVYKLAELLEQRFETGKMVIDIWKGTDKIVEDLPSERKYTFKSGVNIMFGCNNFCSYCIVPYVRGRERSRAPEDIIREIEELVKNGVVEIMLLGQNVNSYGKNLESPITFAELLRRVERIEGLKRIRFMTSHPKDLSDELIEVMASSKKICRHLHLPLQSGSSEILKKMNVRYDSAFTFIYSKRTGTPAAAMENQVPEEVVKERFDRLLAEVQAISAQVCGRDVHTVQEVLVEEPDSHVEGLVTGRMSNNTIVHFPGGKELIGKIVKVYLEESKGFYYMGSLVD